MVNQKERKPYEASNKLREFAKPLIWLAQYDEEDDFLGGKVSSYLPEFTEEE